MVWSGGSMQQPVSSCLSVTSAISYMRTGASRARGEAKCPWKFMAVLMSGGEGRSSGCLSSCVLRCYGAGSTELYGDIREARTKRSCIMKAPECRVVRVDVEIDGWFDSSSSSCEGAVELRSPNVSPGLRIGQPQGDRGMFPVPIGN
jgi:hypothetical protein